MKQLLLVKRGATILSSDATTTAQRAKGNLAIIDRGDYYSIYQYNGDGVPPTGQDVVWKNTLNITKTEPELARAFKATITVPTPEDDKDYVIVLIKKSAVFNQRDVWTTSARKTVTANTAALVAAQLAKNINKSSNTSGVVATVSGAVVTLDGTGDVDFAVKFYAEAADNTITDIGTTLLTSYKKGVGDKAFVQELAHKCIADRGIEFTDAVGRELYTDYANDVEDNIPYTILNLRYYNPKHDHRIDEPLYQVLHVAVPADSISKITVDGNELSVASSD